MAIATAGSVSDHAELYGTVRADKVVAVSSRVTAAVTAVHVKGGDVVSAGQALVEIDPQTARGQEAQARGALAQAQAALTLAERNFERFRALAAKDAASELEVDMARMQLDQARGAVAQGQGAVEAASSVARESRVVAPFAGRVVRRLVEVGDLAAPGRPLVQVESGKGRRLVVPVPERLVNAAKLAVGSPVQVAVDVLPGRQIAGRVAEMTPGADPASHNFTIEVDLGAAEVPSGVAGRASLAVGARQAVMVPREAVIAYGGLSLVVVRDADGRARSRAVTLGGEANGLVEVLSGVTNGESVALGLASVPEDGTPLEVRS